MLAVKLTPVKSSNLTAVGYNAEEEALVVLFHSGQTYRYSPVSLDTYNELLTAESVGQYLNQNIKFNPKVICKQM